MTDVIELAYGLEANIESSHLQRAAMLVNYATSIRKGKRDPGYTDDKCLVFGAGIDSLVQSGATVTLLNNTSQAYPFYHKVTYKGFYFNGGSNSEIKR